ncbi:MAG TPA: hypothetical protein VK019_07560 [Pseudomonas sp.]|nr:hypothetical protein [Pseudomonas sp.]
MTAMTAAECAHLGILDMVDALVRHPRTLDEIPELADAKLPVVVPPKAPEVASES